MERRLRAEDPMFRDDVRRRAAEGLSTEMAAACRKRFAVLQAIVIAALAFNLAVTISQKGAASLQGVASITAMVVVVVAAGSRYRRFRSRPGRVVDGEALMAVAARSHRCAKCGSVLLPTESDCPRCGSLRHPGQALAFGIIFGLAMTALAIWRSGVFAK